MSDFTRLSRVALEAMAESGRALVASERAMAAAGTSPLAEALRGASAVYEWRHYPDGDVYDPQSHAQYFYHAHPAGERKPVAGGPLERGEEHGHFHTFLRARGMPAGVSPLVMPEFAVPNNPAAPKAPLIPSAPQTAEGEAPIPGATWLRSRWTPTPRHCASLRPIAG